MSAKALTKREKKVQALKQRKGKPREEVLDVPIVDVVEDDAVDGPPSIVPAQTKKDSQSKPSKKRKRDEMELDDAKPVQKSTATLAEKTKPKTKKATDPVDDESEHSDSESAEKSKKQTSAPKYILFVGQSCSLEITLIPFLTL